MIDDPALPAAAALTGPDAGDILRPAIEQGGGRLFDHTCVHVQYRPGSDIVAQFRVEVAWGAGERKRETVVAGITTDGAPPGTVPVVATSGEVDLEVGVWRWPFDPLLRGLDQAVRPSGAARMLTGLEVSGPLRVTVVAYRPTERAVLRLESADRTVYLKLVRPDRLDLLVRQHRLLREADLPVPQVLATDAEGGWMAMNEMSGPTARERIKSGTATWMRPDALRGVVERLRSVDGSALPAVRTRLADAPIHGAILATVVPDLADRLESLGSAMEAEVRDVAREPTVVHGDLHEGQLVVDDSGSISGLLDVDGVGLGDPIDDVAVPLGHLRYRAAMAEADGARLTRHTDELATALLRMHSRPEVAVATSAVMVGLATGPFRRQGAGWQQRVRDTIGLAEDLLDAGP